MIFEPPPERVLGLMTQTVRYREFMTRIQSIENHGRTATTSVDEFHLTILFKSFRLRVNHEWDLQGLCLRFALDPSFDNDPRSYEGLWQLYAYERGTTLGRYRTQIDVGPLLPLGVQRMLTRQKLPDAMRRLQQWVDAQAEPGSPGLQGAALDPAGASGSSRPAPAR